MNVFRPVALIPVYNHHQVMTNCLMCWDLSTYPSFSLTTAAMSSAPVRWTSQPHHIGRQVSCALQKTRQRGGGNFRLYVADNMNFTHAIQIDADGQHDLAAVTDFLDQLTITRRHLSAAIPFTIRRSPCPAFGGESSPTLGACQHALKSTQRRHVRLSRLPARTNASCFALC